MHPLRGVPRTSAPWPPLFNPSPARSVSSASIATRPALRKRGTSPYELQWPGKRGKPVKSKRLIPAERAHAIARKLQGTPGVTVSGL